MNLYFNNAATSYPKPPEVAEAMAEHLRRLGGNPGRGEDDRSLATARVVEAARESLADYLGISRSERLVFTFNATTAINAVLRGLPLRGARVLVSPLEHHAVMRTLASLSATCGLTWEILPHEPDGTVIPERIREVLKPDVNLTVINHQGNVNGVIQPIPEIREALKGVPLLVDGAQSAGEAPCMLDEWGVDYFCFTGHKGLLGPTGVGGFYVRDPESLQPVVTGGTGSHSESYDMPGLPPDRFEAGTLNTVGLAGLDAALLYKPAPAHSQEDFRELLQRIANTGGYRLFVADDFTRQGSAFSLVPRSLGVRELADILFRRFRIESRPGLHCAALAHRTLGSFPNGAVRFSLSPYHTSEELTFLAETLEGLA
jgi:cysteine desulfurase family protein